MAEANEKDTMPITSLAPIERGDTATNAEYRNLDPTKGRVTPWSSLDPATQTHRSRLYNAMVGDAKPIDQYIDKLIEVEHVVVHPVDLTDPISGEVRQAARVVLIAPNGVMYGCVSHGIFESIRKLSQVFGPLPWAGGMLVKPVQIRTRQGYRVYNLNLPSDAEKDAYAKAKAESEKKAAAK